MTTSNMVFKPAAFIMLIVCVCVLENALQAVVLKAMPDLQALFSSSET